jgi:hypothetical protein
MAKMTSFCVPNVPLDYPFLIGSSAFSNVYVIAEREIKWLGYIVFVFREKPLYEVCLVRLKEQAHVKQRLKE